MDMLDMTCDDSMSSLWYLAKYHFVRFLRCVRECARVFTLERCHCRECSASRACDDTLAYTSYAHQNDTYNILARYSTGTLGLAISEILARLAGYARTRTYFDVYANELADLQRYLFSSGNVPLVVPFALYAPRAQLLHEIRTFILRHDHHDTWGSWQSYDCEFESRGFCETRLEDIDEYEKCYDRRCEEDASDLSEDECAILCLVPSSDCWRLPGVHSTSTMQALHLMAVACQISYCILHTCECVYQLERVRAQTLNITRRYFPLDTLSEQAARQLFLTQGALALVNSGVNFPPYIFTAFRRTVCELQYYYFVELVMQGEVLLPHVQRCVRQANFDSGDHEYGDRTYDVVAQLIAYL